MVHLDVVRSCNSSIVKAQPLVGVFFGGTSGIGESAVRALATAHGTSGKGLRVYIIGRNKAAGEKTVSDCLQACPTGRFRFIRTDDLSLLGEVDRVCTELIKAEEEEARGAGQTARVDFLVMSHAYLAFEARRGIYLDFHCRDFCDMIIWTALF